MAADYTIKQGDFGEAIKTVLTDTANSLDFTLIDAVKINMLEVGSNTPVLSGVAATILSATTTSLTAEYVWQSGDTNTIGLYNVEWAAYENTVLKKTFPSGGYNTVEIVAKLA